MRAPAIPDEGTKISAAASKPLRIMALLPGLSLENLLIVTAMSFDTAAIIDHNGTVLNAAQIASRSAPQPYLRRMMDKTRADNNGSGATALMHRRVK
jgi:hypothetical protein